jgi:nucleoside-diphosphate-sugar epimerase
MGVRVLQDNRTAAGRAQFGEDLLASPRVVAVTGGSGQLGTLVLRRLLDDVDIARVISIDRRPPMIGSAKLESIIGDVCDGDFARHLQGVDAVIHCAFIISGSERSSLFRAVNVEGSKNVFRAAVSAGVTTIVFVSSITAYGVVAGHPVPIVETTPRVRQADFAYAACKFDVEAFLDEVEPHHPDIAVSRIRANVLMGRRMQHLLGDVLRIGWIPDLDGVPLPIVWDEDVADLIVLALKRGARGAFNAAADELLPATELAARTGARAVKVSRLLLFMHTALYELLTRLNVHLLSDPSWATRTKAPLIGSSEKARRELGWSPRYGTAVAVVERFRAVSPWRLDVWLLVVLWMLARATRHAPGCLAGRSGRLFLCLNGPVAGDFSLIVEDGKMRARAGAPPRPTSTVTMTATLFRDLLAGRAAFDDAMASGDIDWFGAEADRDLLKRIVAIPTQRESEGGWRGAAAQLAARWC